MLYSRKGHTDGNFTDLRNAGRLDVVHECIVASLFLSHGLRRDVVFSAFLTGPPLPPLCLRVDGTSLYDVRTDQETWQEILRKVLSGKPHPGVSTSKTSFEELIKERSKEGEIFVLEEKGRDFELMKGTDHPIFVLGDHIGLPRTVENFVLRYGEKISLGRQPYLAASCITVLNFILDGKKVG
jgi:tRNA (pseudouridine54-N1)-methyltransferase